MSPEGDAIFTSLATRAVRAKRLAYSKVNWLFRTVSECSFSPSILITS